ncbi:hypothetical protein RDI58_023947 [Solanum bulbocastanum]|uniref:Uncharacterized protein n=1 Tax=Solanum bulbocastanum TaxID=147425 RepID=A0AAN8SWT5_SOLBU
MAPGVVLCLETPTEFKSVCVVKTPIAPPKKCYKWKSREPTLSSAKYFHLRPSISSQQSNLKLESTNCRSKTPKLAFSGNEPTDGTEGAEARSALIRRVSRTILVLQLCKLTRSKDAYTRGIQVASRNKRNTSCISKQGSPIHERNTSCISKQGSPIHERNTSCISKQGSPIHERNTSCISKQGSPIHERNTSCISKQGSP